MQLNDEGIIISTRAFGETSAIVDLLTKNYGRHAGLVRGAYSKNMRGILQIGNKVAVAWRGRLGEHLGHYTLEAKKTYSPHWIKNNYNLFALQTIAAHLRLLPARDKVLTIYEKLEDILANVGTKIKTGEQVVRFELLFLQQLGFGLDLRDCAATGSSDNLIYVSPRSARAVCEKAGKPYANKLLPLPNFLLPQVNETDISAQDICNGLNLTSFFLLKHIYNDEKNKLPIERNSLYKIIKETK